MNFCSSIASQCGPVAIPYPIEFMHVMHSSLLKKAINLSTHPRAQGRVALPVLGQVCEPSNRRFTPSRVSLEVTQRSLDGASLRRPQGSGFSTTRDRKRELADCLGILDLVRDKQAQQREHNIVQRGAKLPAVEPRQRILVWPSGRVGSIPEGQRRCSIRTKDLGSKKTAVSAPFPGSVSQTGGVSASRRACRICPGRWTGLGSRKNSGSRGSTRAGPTS